jgi:hypothetical protein
MALKRNPKVAVFRVVSLRIAILAVSVATAAIGQEKTASQPYTLSALSTRKNASPSASGTVLFLPAVTYGAGGTFAESVAVADVNGDGKPDLVVANCVPSGFSTCAGKGVVGVLLGNGDGTFQPVVTHDSGGFGANSVAVADLNGDGSPDLVVANECGSNMNCPGNGWVTVLLGNGDGTFESAVGYGSGGFVASSVAVADVDNDGRLDLVVTNHGSGTVGVLRGNGDGTFQPAATYSSVGNSGGYGPLLVAIADVNGDGKQDVVVADQYQGGSNGIRGAIGVLLGNGDGTFQSAITYTSGGNVSFSVAVADINGDGRPDLIVANLCVVSDTDCTENAPVGVLLGKGDGTFEPVVTYLSGGAYAISVAVADINGDGNPDLLVANVNSSTVGALLGNGDGTFQPATTYGSGGHPLWVAVADVNEMASPTLCQATTPQAQ